MEMFKLLFLHLMYQSHKQKKTLMTPYTWRRTCDAMPPSLREKKTGMMSHVHFTS